MNMDWSETLGPQINDTIWRILQNTNEVLSTVCAVPTASSSDREGVNRPCASAQERIGPTQEDESIPTRMEEENEETQDPGKRTLDLFESRRNIGFPGKHPTISCLYHSPSHPFVLRCIVILSYVNALPGQSGARDLVRY
jgi:hypothetical protein